MTIKDYPSLVIAGIWNLGILSPPWFAKEFPDLVKQKEVPLEIQLGTNSLRFTINGIIINPNPNKLIFFSKTKEDSQYELIEQFAQGVVSRLPHTPITALGHNISYFTDEEEFSLFEKDILNKCEDSYKSKLNISALNSQETVHSLSYENFNLNLTYNFNRKKKFVSFNYHYEVTDIEKIKVYIAEFKKNIEHSAEIFSKLVV
jgi:hypothetical protein